MPFVQTAVTGKTLQRVQGLLAQARDVDGFLRDAGEVAVYKVIPARFAAGGPGWDPVARGGVPLSDRGILKQSNTFEVEGHTLTVGNTQPQARLMNRGGPLAGQTPSREAETVALKALSDRLGPRYASAKPRYTRKGSIGWMYVHSRPFMYWGEEMLAKIGAAWFDHMKKGTLR